MIRKNILLILLKIFICLFSLNLQSAATIENQVYDKTEISDINAQDSYGNTPLMRACVINDLNILQILLAQDADTQIRNNDGKTALEIAQEFRHTSLVSKLLKHNVEKKLQLKLSGNTEIVKKRKLEEKDEAKDDSNKELSDNEDDYYEPSPTSNSTTIKSGRKRVMNSVTCECGCTVGSHNYGKHLKIHEKFKTPFICNECKITSYFKTQQRLGVHISVYHKVKHSRKSNMHRKKCVCGIVILVTHEKKHMNIHKVKTKYECTQCLVPSYLKSAKTLIEHKEKYHGGSTSLEDTHALVSQPQEKVELKEEAKQEAEQEEDTSLIAKVDDTTKSNEDNYEVPSIGRLFDEQETVPWIENISKETMYEGEDELLLE